MPYIVDTNIPVKALNELKKYDKVCTSTVLYNIYEPVNTHPDIQIHFVKDNLAFCLKECFDYYRKILPDIVEIIKIEEDVDFFYPGNVLLNIAVFGKNVVCNTKYISKKVLSYYTERNYRIISVKQGYAKCNICIVDKNAVITEDSGIANKLAEYEDIDVCYIKSGYVNLDNFKYGFIGGASGIIDKHTIGFYGKLRKHPEYTKIKLFLDKYKMSYIELGDGGLHDFGSILKF